LPTFARDKYAPLLTGLFLWATGLAGQELKPPPDFTEGSIAAPAEEVAGAWTRWRAGDKSLEQKIYRLPMIESRDLLQRSLGRYLDFLDKRKAYTQAVTAVIDGRRNDVRPRPNLFTMETINRDQIETLGVNLAALQEKLAALRDSPDWLALRRAVQAESSQALALESARRAEAPVDSLLTKQKPVSAVSAAAYLESERQLAEALQKLWTRYYQSLADAVEKRPAGSIVLTALKPSDGAPAAPASTLTNPMLGVWTYVEGSQEFNGAGEPRQVMLELWIENGLLAGRYRAELPDFHGVQKLDMRLRGAAVGGSGRQTLEFETKDAARAGSVLLEGPGPTGMELMLVRVVPAQSTVPRGRESLRRR
jgi:hypothetical protein